MGNAANPHEEEDDMVPSDEEEDDEEVPLVPRSSNGENNGKTTKKIEPLEIEETTPTKKPKASSNFELPVCFVVFMAFGCSTLLFFVMFQPTAHHSVPSHLTADVCDQSHIEELMVQIEGATDFCDPINVSML